MSPSPALVLLSLAAHANEDGITGFARAGCTDCHGEAPDPSVSVELSAEATAVEGGQTVALLLRVASTDPAHAAAGLDVAADDGVLAGGASLLWREHELTHAYPHALEAGAHTFELWWTAPAYSGTYTVHAAGNAVDFDHWTTGDGWATDALVMQVSSDCTDADGDRVGDCEGDCDDTDPAVHPGAEETWYDGVDADCAGDDDHDADGDGVSADADCDDADPARSAPEDCAPATDGGDDSDGGAADGGGSDTGAATPPAEPSKGCATAPGAGLLLALPLLVARRRRAGSHADTGSQPGRNSPPARRG